MPKVSIQHIWYGTELRQKGNQKIKLCANQHSCSTSGLVTALSADR